MANPNAAESNASQWPKFGGFAEFPVKRKEIRVLHLKDIKDGRLNYSMHNKNISTETYSALSYSWGAPVPNTSMKTITINEQKVMIRPTLNAVLSMLAICYHSIVIWIDAICIDQANIEERNHQISMMDDVYRNATKVFVWLGQGDDDTNYAMDHISNKIPGTAFELRQFELSIEKLFQASYWTRRWVLQEFALARELLIICGSYVVSWQKLTKFIADRMSKSNFLLLATMEKFKQLQVSDNQTRESLLELMSRFEHSRCIDRRDKAFALRGIADDGASLVPDYKESVGDVFFRLLSMQPTYGVYPDPIGYRWPHSDINNVIECLSLTGEDVLAALMTKTSDRLHVALEYVGQISSVTQIAPVDKGSLSLYQAHIETRYQSQTFPVYHSGDLQSGFLLYSLPTKELYVTFQPDHAALKASGILYVAPGKDSRALDKRSTCFKMVEDICLHGIIRCVRNMTARTATERIVCHISRIAMVCMWLTVKNQESLLLGQYQSLKNIAPCTCSGQCNPGPNARPISSKNRSRQSPHLEIMPVALQSADPSNDSITDPIWGGANVDIFTKAIACERNRMKVSTKLETGSAVSEQALIRNGRSDLSLAAGNGLFHWTQILLQPLTPEPAYRSAEYHQLRTGDDRGEDLTGRTALSWAAASGNCNVVRLLLDSSDIDPNKADRGGYTPLNHAITSGDSKMVEVLLKDTRVDPMLKAISGRTPLSWTVQAGSASIVEIMLASSRVEPDGEDVDGMTPLLWAARYNHTRIVELLLNTKRVDCNSRDLTGRTALSHAAEKGSESMARSLLAQSDIEPDLMDHERITPLIWASRNTHSSVVQLLLAAGVVDHSGIWSRM